MDRELAYKHFLSLGWTETPHAKHVFEFTMRAAADASGGALLDAGSGFLACKPFFDESIYIGQEHPASGYDAKGIREYDILCDVQRIPINDYAVRTIFSNVSLEHMRYPEPFFREAYRVLEPGGSLFIHVPFVYMEHEQPYDFQRPTSFGLRRWFDDAGFEECNIMAASSSIYTTTWAARIAVEEELKRRPLRGVESWIAKAKVGIFLKFLDLINHSFDRGPFSGVQFPISWTAIGRKGGKRPVNIRNITAKQFLELNKTTDAVFDGNTLVLQELNG